MKRFNVYYKAKKQVIEKKYLTWEETTMFLSGLEPLDDHELRIKQVEREMTECRVVQVDDLKVPYEILPIEVNLKEIMQGEYNRAEKKEQDRKLADKYVSR